MPGLVRDFGEWSKLRDPFSMWVWGPTIIFSWLAFCLWLVASKQREFCLLVALCCLLLSFFLLFACCLFALLVASLLVALGACYIVFN